MKVPKIKKKIESVRRGLFGQQNKIFEGNGDYYEGEWKNNLKHGYGTQKWSKENLMYIGYWKNGKRSGKGVLYPANNCHIFLYNGAWKNDKRNGDGIAIFADGSKYSGDWVNDKREGIGTMQYVDGPFYAGQWHKDRRHGQGVMSYADGSRYSGTWKRNKRRGKGTLVTKTGIYEGGWLDDNKHGDGIFIDLSSGRKLEGVWILNTLRCSTCTDGQRDIRTNELQNELPLCILKDPEAVFDQSRKHYLEKGV